MVQGHHHHHNNNHYLELGGGHIVVVVVVAAAAVLVRDLCDSLTTQTHLPQDCLEYVGVGGVGGHQFHHILS